MIFEKNLKDSFLLFIPILFFLFNTACFIILVANLVANSQNISSNLGLFILNFSLFFVIYQNFLNLVHQSSHQAIFKNRFLNYSIGFISALVSGFTLADFKSTHLLHHAFLGQPGKDPDEEIVHTKPAFFMPFAIWKHDRFFWKHKLYAKNNYKFSYLITRFSQLLIISCLTINGFFNHLIFFWLLPLLLVGILNGIFLFYFPHYMPSWENKLRLKKESKNLLNLFKKIPLTLINISRIYHEIHHNNVRSVNGYFPLVFFVIHFFQNKWPFMLKKHGTKYILTKKFLKI